MEVRDFDPAGNLPVNLIPFIREAYTCYFRRAFILARTAENIAPAPPTRASTTVGFSGESVHPVCAYSGIVASAAIAKPRNTTVDFFMQTSPIKPDARILTG
jgi:hypothetical protein